MYPLARRVVHHPLARGLFLLLCVFSLLASLFLSGSGYWSVSTDTAYFRFEYEGYPETFVIQLNDPVKIQHARDLLAGSTLDPHVMGTIITQPAAYNPPWSYHLDPDSIEFFSNAIEICDASIQEVEQRLDEVGSSFLPGYDWCPWFSHLVAEVTPVPTATPSATSIPGSYSLFFPFIRQGP